MLCTGQNISAGSLKIIIYFKNYYCLNAIHMYFVAFKSLKDTRSNLTESNGIEEFVVRPVNFSDCFVECAKCKNESKSDH